MGAFRNKDADQLVKKGCGFKGLPCLPTRIGLVFDLFSENKDGLIIQ